MKIVVVQTRSMKSLTLNLPEDLRQSLEAEARRSRVSVEACAITLLQSLLEPVDDPLASLVGSLTSEVNDLSDRHDEYLGNAIAQELGRD